MFSVQSAPLRHAFHLYQRDLILYDHISYTIRSAVQSDQPYHHISHTIRSALQSYQPSAIQPYQRYNRISYTTVSARQPYQLDNNRISQTTISAIQQSDQLYNHKRINYTIGLAIQPYQLHSHISRYYNRTLDVGTGLGPNGFNF